MKKVFIKRGLKRMLSISLIVTMVLVLPSVSTVKASTDHPGIARASNPAYCPANPSHVHSWKYTHEPQCETGGRQECIYCSRAEIVGPYGHDYQLQSSATCTKAATYKCSRCSRTKTEGSALGHSYSKKVDATCSKGDLYVCDRCGSMKYEGSALGHSWWVTGATCQKGQINTCSRCGTVEEVGYPKEHDYSSNPTVVQNQSCTQPEIIRYYCIYGCGNYQDKQTKAANGHSYTISASATTEHGTEHTCSRCGNRYYDNDKITRYTLYFNAAVNGGTTSERSTQISPGTTFNLLGKTADKNGWEFVGWNTDRTAKTGLSSITMNGNKTLYAIFKKDLTVNFIDG